MTRYWVSWYSGNYEDEGCTKPPFTFWVSGYSFRSDDDSRDDCTICAVIDAPNEDAIWEVVAKHFPDYRYRFCDETHTDYLPGDRFRHDGKILTSLTFKD